jgi:hypothetical protein
MKQNETERINLLDLKPSRNLKWETGEKNEVILSVPKFQNKLLVKYVMPNIKRPYFKIKLDDHGSFIWSLCDGNTTVGKMADKLKEKFGENFDPTYERIGKFVNQLVRDKFLSIENQSDFKKDN